MPKGLRGFQPGNKLGVGQFKKGNKLAVGNRGAMTHGWSRTPTYKVWINMKNRCNCPTNPDYKWYGGRGIRICERWKTFEGFMADMGIKPEGKMIDRIDPNGHYEPTNCRWVTPTESRFNQNPKGGVPNVGF